MTVLFLAPLFKDPQHCVYRVMWEESFANEIDMILKLISRDWFHCYSNKTFSYSNMSSPLLKGNSWLVGWSLWHTAEHNRWSNKHFVVIVFLYSSFQLLCATSSHNNLAWLFKMLWSITHPSEDSVMIILLGHIAHMHRWYLATIVSCLYNCFVSEQLFRVCTPVQVCTPKIMTWQNGGVVPHQCKQMFSYCLLQTEYQIGE